MQFDDAQLVESICYQMRQSSWPRSRNRALINEVFNGFAPFTEEEVHENDIQANYNDLTATRKAHDARGQMYSAILKPGNYFRALADIGPKHSRSTHSETCTRHANRLMKRSMPYYELQRAKIAQAILHGIGPSVQNDRDHWRPRTASLEDILIPTGEATELPMEHLPLFAIHKSLTAPQLIELTRGPNRDPAWQMPVVRASLKWVDEETAKLMTNNWPDNWTAEKWEERRKESAYYGGDAVPTIEVYDFYWWAENGKKSGWKRRMIIDPWGTPDATSAKYNPTRKVGGVFDSKSKNVKGAFLYNPGDRIFASNKSEIVNFQFADLSAVAPFRYHAVRGLGWLLHDACVVQNRLTCKITESTFETLTMLMRVKSQEDVQRALKANLFTRGFVDENVTFIPASDRWQVNTGLVEFGWGKNREMIDQGSSSHSQNQDMSKGVEKGQLQIMAELNATTAMLSAGLLQYYQYQVYEYREIWRRLLNPSPNIVDPEVNLFQAACQRDGVPKSMLSDPLAWDIEPERVLGAGNKTLEMAIAGQLMAFRPLYDAGSQRKILRDVTLAITDDPARADELVPEEPQVSDTVHDTELVFGSLMAGYHVTPKDGENAVEAAGTIIKQMGAKVQEIQQSGGVGTPADVKGMILAAGYASHYIKLLEADKNSKQVAADMNKQLSQIGNLIKAFQQRQAEAQKAAAAQNGAGGLTPEAKSKIAATEAMAQSKIKIGQQSHAEKTAQRRISFEEKFKQDEAKHKMTLHKEVIEHGMEVHQKEVEAASAKRKGSLKSFDE